MPNEAISPTYLHPSLSPARAALADHSRNIARARDEVERASRPVARLKDHLEAANSQLQGAEAALASIDDQHAAAIRDAAKGGGEIDLMKPPANAKAEAAVESGRRVIASVQAALTDCEAECSTARAALANVMAQTDDFVLAVIIGDYDASLERLSRARDEFDAAETQIFALMELLGEYGSGKPGEPPRRITWLRARESARASWGKIPRPESNPAGVMAALARWRGALARLAGDATATG